MILSSSIIIGFIRLCLMILFLYYLNRKLLNNQNSKNYSEFIVNQWFKYGSLTIVLVFILVELNIYNLFNTIFLLLVFICIDYFGIKNFIKPIAFSSKKIKKKFLLFLKNVELKSTVSSFFKTKSNPKERTNNIWQLMLLIFLGSLTFISRFFFYDFDLYSLSSLWITDLKTIIDFDTQNWFLNGVSPVGEFAFTNLYSKIASVSPEIGLQSIGILESVIICTFIFWFINKITPSKTIAPLFAALFFAVYYNLTPVNIDYLLQHKPMFLALTFGLPAMVFFSIPNQLRGNKKDYFFKFLLVFIAIGLIDLFTLIVLILPFLLLGILLSNFKSKIYNLLVFAAYFLSILLLTIIYGLACYYIGNDFEQFFHSSLMSTNSFTYLEHLILPYNELMKYYQYLSLFGIILTLKFIFFNKENWNGALTILVYFNLLLLIEEVNNVWIDADLIKQAIAVFIPILFGIIVAVFLRLLFPFYKKAVFIKPYFELTMIAVIIVSAVYFQKNEFAKLNQTDVTPRKILDSYDKINSHYFPLSYAVVNDYSAQAISINKHFFINYDDFLKDYTDRDSIYFKNIKNEKFLAKYPEYILPKSVLIYMYFQKGKSEKQFIQNNIYSEELKTKMEILKSRGRKIEVFYENDIFKIFEIINIPEESRMNDLIFKK